MKIPTPTQTKSSARIEQPMAKTLPVPTVDSSTAVGRRTGAGASGSAGSVDSELTSSGSVNWVYPAPFQRQAPSSNAKA
jgi:hypothetical protein